MADVAFSGLQALTSLQRADLVCATDDSESSVEKSKKVELGTLQDFLLANGTFIRPQFEWSSATVLKIGAGFYDVDGKYAIWGSQLSETLSGLSTNTRYYVYLDYSAITSGTAITATEIIVSATAPAFSHAKGGFYNGSDRCIFSFMTESGSTDMVKFFHDGGRFVEFDEEVAAYSIAYPSTDWSTQVTFTCPAFCESVMANFFVKYSAGVGTYYGYYRQGGSSGSGHRVGWSFYTTGDAQVAATFNQMRCAIDSSRQIDIKVDRASSRAQMAVYQNGWFFPAGM